MLKFKPLAKPHIDFPSLVRHIILAWLTSVAIEYFKLPEPLRDLSKLDGMAQMSLERVLLLTYCFTVVLYVISTFLKIDKFERLGIALVFSLIAGGTLWASISRSYLAVCVLILTALVVFCWFGWDRNGASIHKKSIYLRITAAFAVAFFVFVSAWTASRVYSFGASTYDFGIFAQMFHSMKQTGLPMTTLERDGMLSHFAVHVSPIYYLMLPLYCVFPDPATLQVLQALVLASAVIPLWLIGKHHGLTELQRMLVCIILLLFPAFSGGTSYDLHENCFLTPLILWTLYGIDKKNTVITAVAGVLTLLVKEDAAVYVAVIALWLLVKTALQTEKPEKKEWITGLAMLAASICWFFLVTTYLSRRGDGVMTYRYDNFMYDGSSSLFTVIKSIILNPMKLVYECVDPEKLKFIAQTLIPLLGLPLLTRRYERYLLLIPYVLVNLMSDYPYQHDIFFQYTYGSTAFLFYLTIVNLADVQISWKRISVLALAAVISAGFFGKVILPTGITYTIRAIERHEYYQTIRDALDTIPEDASVVATGYYTVYLSQRETLYDLRYCSTPHLLESEYVVMSSNAEGECTKYASDGLENGMQNLITILESYGYQKCESPEDILLIYRKANP